MRQRHSIVLWKKAERENKDIMEIAKEAKSIKESLQLIDDWCRLRLPFICLMLGKDK